MWTIVGVYAVLLLACTLYAMMLQRIHDWYTPDYIWVTVVGGNLLIGLALLALCWGGVLPYAAFWHLVGLNIAGGIPIIVWQLWQHTDRNTERNSRRG